MHTNCGIDHDRTEAGSLAINEENFIDELKNTLINAINAYSTDDWSFGAIITGRQVISSTRHPWMPWKRVFTEVMPSCWRLSSTVEIYPAHGYIDDAKEVHHVILGWEADEQATHHLIHAAVWPAWAREEAIAFMNDHGWREVKHVCGHLNYTDGRGCTFTTFVPYT